MEMTNSLFNFTVPWRQIAEPRPDVAQGKFRQAEFAADLSQVLSGKAVIEYQDPIEFFDRTYLTDGIKRMLIKAIIRVSGKGTSFDGTAKFNGAVKFTGVGEPVIQLKTAFGGGKTHSMLALYHLMRSSDPEKLYGITDVFNEAGVKNIPKVNVAAIVGTALDPNVPRRSEKYPDITINTLWGEMTAQLAEASENPALYELIKEADKKGVSPGSTTIKKILEKCDPCLILIDELVAYARKLYGLSQGAIPAGTFENVLSFVQELTEAVRATNNCIVVASIPESETEAGGDAGIQALKRIEHTFGRMEAVWKPVVAEEGYEIVRRRLFMPIENKEAIEKTCKAYFSIYQNNPALFPPECKEADYFEKMKRCYPIHPEVFDRLYNDWATIDHFQRTRGVLRLMAAVINDLYSNNDGSSLITSGSIAIGKPSIRDELTRYLSAGWNPIIESEIDGKNAKPPKLDDSQGGYYKKQFAYNRISRTVFLGSAPSSQAQRNRGIDSSHVYLGVIQPEENIPAYEAALRSLADNLTYLYHSESRYWFDTRPTLRKTMMDRAQHQAQETIIEAIETELKNINKYSNSICVSHTAVKSSSDIPDDQDFHLVLFRAEDIHETNNSKSTAMSVAKEYFENRGTSPRIHRNMIAFLAPDKEQISHICQEMKILLAWKSIKKDADVLNLDVSQRRETDDTITEKSQLINELIQDAWCHLIVPTQEGTDNIILKDMKVTGVNNPVKKAIQRMKQDELLIDVLSPKILSMEMSKTDQELWQGNNHISLRELWSNYTKYVYLHRLKDRSVLERALEAGIRSGEYFAYAEEKDESGKYKGVISDTLTGFIHLAPDGLIVKPNVIKSQFLNEGESVKTTPDITSTSIIDKPQPTTLQKKTHFWGSVKLDHTKLGSTAGQINTEILQHFSQLQGASVKVSIDIQVEVPSGIPDDVIRIVDENRKTLKFDDSSGFD